MAADVVQLFDRAANRLVEAVVRRNLTPRDLLLTEQAWAPGRVAMAIRHLEQHGTVPEHVHWDWGRKSSALGGGKASAVGIECHEAFQGLAMLATVGHHALLPPHRGEPLLYVEFIEVAPWNDPNADHPGLGNVGTALVAACVRESLAAGRAGRLGLHSLPQSEGFYRRLGMTSVEAGRKDGLAYYEFTGARAEAFSQTGVGT